MRPDAALLALGMAVWAAGAVAQDACAESFADLRDAYTQVRFQVEVADDSAEQARGLMNRESLPKFSGMLFVYDRPQPVAFWMENTLIPLDMLFFDASGRLTHIHPNAIPLDRTAIPGKGDVRFVLELNGGTAAALGIGLGAELRHPAVDPALAVWPCSAG